MEENNPQKRNKLSAKAQKEIKEIAEVEARKAQWHSEMMASATVRQFFEQYNEASVVSYLDYYLSQKNAWVRYGDMYASMKENEELRFDNEAQEYLKVIQHKKLFELQCLWRAEKIQLPGVQLTYDFWQWENNVLNCPFIDPVTEEDIALCRQYLLGGNVDIDGDWSSLEWQNYDELKAGYNDDNEGWYPAWYEFVDNRKGVSNILLPDIRSEKESFYRDLYFDSQREAREAESAAYQKSIEGKKPSLSWYDDKATEFLIQTFESKEVQHQYKAYKWGTDDMWERENVQAMIDLLKSADEPVPIEANQDWFQGLNLAVFKYKCKKIAEALPRVWEQYNMNVQMGIAFPAEDDYGKEAYDSIRKQILIGRKLNGEPEDLNF